MAKFAWSWSRLKNWRACPKRHYHIEIAKDIKEPESEALKWGSRFHTAMAGYVDKGTPLPQTLDRYEPLPAMMRRFKQAGATILVEKQYAIDDAFRPTEWFDSNTWLRAVVDVLGISEQKKKAVAVDWKTGGKIEPEFEQLGITASVIFSHYPKVDTVHTTYVWSAHDDAETTKVYHRDEMSPFWAKLLPEINRWKKDAEEMTYPPRPSGLCKNYCPVTHCAYHGKGGRV